MVDLQEHNQLQKFADVLVTRGIYSTVALKVVGPWGRVLGLAGGATEESVFDLASLSKPFLSTLALWLSEQGRLDLGEVVFPEHLERPVSLEALFRHQAGAESWWPLYRRSPPEAEPDRSEKLERFLFQLLCSERWKRQSGVYSDLGYMTAAFWMRERLQCGIESLFEECWAELLPRAAVSRSILVSGSQVCNDPRWAPCDLDTTKEVELASELGAPVTLLGDAPAGLPQDGNARFMRKELGLHAGHAGLFGSLSAVSDLGEKWLAWAQAVPDQHPYLAQKARQGLEPKDGRLLGWFRRDGSSSALSSESFGHTGFVGGGLWIDPYRQLVATMVGYRSDPMSDLMGCRNDFCRLATLLAKPPRL